MEEGEELLGHIFTYHFIGGEYKISFSCHEVMSNEIGINTTVVSNILVLDKDGNICNDSPLIDMELVERVCSDKAANVIMNVQK
jgi:hypothetical protein